MLGKGLETVLVLDIQVARNVVLRGEASAADGEYPLLLFRRPYPARRQGSGFADRVVVIVLEVGKVGFLGSGCHDDKEKSVCVGG